jgi:hypothetical protein
MSVVGHKPTSVSQPAMSAYRPLATAELTPLEVGDVPIADIIAVSALQMAAFEASTL